MRRAHKGLSGKQEMALELVMCGMNDGAGAAVYGMGTRKIGEPG